MSRSITIVLWIVVALLVVGGVSVAVKRGDFSGVFANVGTASAYQAVFLTDARIYFGKTSNINGQYVMLKDVFYLQVNDPTEDPSRPENISLVKLGNELHGPQDEMKINRDHILFIETLRDDSSVVGAINRFKSGE